MAQDQTLNIWGLYTNPSDLADVPAGALEVADNITTNRHGIAKPRRGFDRLPGPFTNLDNRGQSTMFYDGKTLVHNGASTLSYHTGLALTDYSGSYSPPDSATPIRGVESNENFYFTTSTGIKKLTSGTSTPTSAGMPKGLDLQAAVSGSSGFLGNNNRTTYRVLWALEDANGNLLRGAPSQRESVTSTAGVETTRTVDITSTIPNGVTTAYFFEVYRSEQIDVSGGAAETSDELYLVLRRNPTSSEISNGYISITDDRPDELKGEIIYTAPSQGGIESGNEPPPLAKDIIIYQGHGFYFNTVSKHRFTLTLDSIGGSNGLTANDTISIGGVTYTAKASETIASAEFKVFTGGVVDQDIRDTALSLIKVINRHTLSTVYAYYLSGPDDRPGVILLEERLIGGAAFTLTASRPLTWFPSDIPTSGTTKTSDNDAIPNGGWYTKFRQLDAVPLKNSFRGLGSKKQALIRGVPLRNGIMLFKEDGLYQLTGTTPETFQISLLDSSVILLAPNSIAVVDNVIYALTTKGVVPISETGVLSAKPISWPIENTLLELQGLDLDAYKAYTFGISYESEKQYILCTISTAGETYSTQQFVYNTTTGGWVRWDRQVLSGGVNPVDDKLYLCDAQSAYIFRERKDYTYTDYGDYLFSETVTDVSVDGLTLTMAQSDLIEEGDVIQQGTKFAYVISRDSIVGTITVATDVGFTTGSVDIIQAFDCRIRWLVKSLGTPATLNHYKSIHLLFRKMFMDEGELVTTSDLNPTEIGQTIQGTGVTAWGLRPWGYGPWGGTRGRKTTKKWVPRNHQRAGQINVEFRHRRANTDFELQGLVLFGDPTSDRIGRA